ncbi:MAG: tetratricopeptide repeat protein [Kiloniellales bacterium]
MHNFGYRFLAAFRKSFKGIVIILLTFVLASCDGAESRQAEFLERGKELYEAGDYVRASVEFRNVLQIEPQHVESRYYLGLIAEAQDEFEGAYRSFQAVAQMDPEHVESRLRLARYLLLGNQLDDAKARQQELLQLAPENLDVQVLSAAIALREDDLNEAQRLAEVVLAARPASAEATSVLAGVYTARGDVDAAITTVEQTLQSQPDDPALNQLMLQLLASVSRNDEVVALYRELLERNPDDFALRVEFSQFLFAQGDAEETAAVLRTAVRDDTSDSEPRLVLASFLARTQGVDAAITELRAGIEASPDLYDYRFVLSDLLFQSQRLDEARSELREVIERAGTDEDGLNARTALARLELSQNNRPAAQQLIDEVLEVDDGNAGSRLLQGILHLADGEAEVAISDFRTALRANPDSVEALRFLARAELAQGEVALATQTLDRLVRVAPRDTDALGVLATLQAQQGNPSIALTTLDRALGIDPQSPGLLGAKAQLSTVEGRWSDAQEAISALAELPDQGDLGNLLLGRLYHEQGRYEEAFNAFEDIRTENPGAHVAIAGSVRALLAAEQTDRALAYLEQTRASQPNDPYVATVQGEVLLTAARFTDAANSFREAIELDPGTVPAYVGLASALQGAGDIEATLAAYREGLSAVPNDPILLMQFGSTLAGQQQNLEALDIFSQLVEIQPQNLVAVNNYASLVAGLQPENTEALERADALLTDFRRSTNPFVLDTIGAVLLRLGDYRQAQAYLERSIGLDGDLAEAHYHLGLVLFALGDNAGAVDHLETSLEAGRQFLGHEEATETLAAAQEALQQEAEANPATSTTQ